MEQNIYFCDYCNETIFDPHLNRDDGCNYCPNCFNAVRKLTENDCIECGKPLGSCVCVKDNYCTHCGSENMSFDDIRGEFYCHDCKKYNSEVDYDKI